MYFKTLLLVASALSLAAAAPLNTPNVADVNIPSAAANTIPTPAIPSPVIPSPGAEKDDSSDTTSAAATPDATKAADTTPKAPKAAESTPEATKAAESTPEAPKAAESTPAASPAAKESQNQEKPSGGSSGGYNGDGTYYDVGLGACGQTNSNGEMVAALNVAQYGGGNNGAPVCGKKAEVTGPKGKVTVTIVDKCPGCANGDLDLSPSAFNQIADQAAGRVPISWQWAD
ncbi:uncharacterized protein VTP21DRAFT_9497 [Calcarisporiella thermophila]|uniref:uncharacterized protein n=1 Tax=Calcarisporiella thermophila TaxID=911321 RepID=UPI003743496E